MPEKTALALPKPPKELKDLAKFLERRGYSLAFPFDNIRMPGYIGRVDDNRHEIIVDDGKCLKGVEKRKDAKVQLGNYQKYSRFSLGSFLNLFGDIFKLNLDALKTRSVAITFPNPLLKSEYITEVDLEEYLPRVTGTCRKKLTGPGFFVLLQVIGTDSMGYTFELKSKLSADAKAKIEQRIGNLSVGDAQVKVEWESDAKFSVVVSGTTLTVGYKAARTGVQTLAPAELAALKKSRAG